MSGSAAGSSAASAPASSGGLPLVRGRCHAEHPTAQGPGHADGGQPDAAAGTEDQHGLAGRRTGAVAEGEQARAVALGERGGPGGVHTFGQRDGRARRHDDAAGEAAEAHRGQHPVADGHPADVGAHGDDVPGHLAARHEGERGLHLVLPGDEESVDEVHAGRLDGDRDLARAGFGVGPFLHPQHGGRAELVADGGAHGCRRYRHRAWSAPVPATHRLARRDELASSPAVAAAADTAFGRSGTTPRSRSPPTGTSRGTARSTPSAEPVMTRFGVRVVLCRRP